MCNVIFAKHHLVPQLANQCSDQLADKMLDSDKNFDILRAIKPYSFEPLVKKVTDSINCEELTAASAYLDQEQSAVPPAPVPVHNKSWIVAYLFVFT